MIRIFEISQILADAEQNQGEVGTGVLGVQEKRVEGGEVGGGLEGQLRTLQAWGQTRWEKTGLDHGFPGKPA